tara:strand:+ start:3556 stop:4626 length:1071 start_codon:yes stop_codon:yes gene_type:complete
MNVCILGNGLTSLTLAKALVNKGVNVDIFFNKKKDKTNYYRTIGISKTNLEFFNKEILDINKLSWSINKIEIYSENLNNERILDFQNTDQKLFSIIKNYELIDYLTKNLKREKLCKFKKNLVNKKILSYGYDLIINCEFSNFITKKFFSKRIKKNYNNYAYTTIIKHSKISNNKAIQIFTSKGPLAFLPISKFETSIVYSINGDKKNNFKDLIRFYNKFYKILHINDFSRFKLQMSNLRNYYHGNILAFGDLLHKIHPLAGQGFNMTLRDIKIFSEIVQKKINLGLPLDLSVNDEFEKKSKHINYIFSNGIDFIYEFFNFERKTKSKIFSRTAKFLGKNLNLNKKFIEIADNGFLF